MSEHEERRQELITEIEQDSGENWREQHRPGSVSCHELLDRTSMIADMLEQYIVEHPACFENPAWFELASEAAARLHELYQVVGRVHLVAEEEGLPATTPAVRLPA